MQMKKFIGKPYAGKPHVRFDEGVGKVHLSFPLYSTELGAPRGVRLYKSIPIRMKEPYNPIGRSG